MEPIRRPDPQHLVHAVKFRLKATPLDANHIADVVVSMFDEVLVQVEQRLAELEQRVRRLEER
ncbi:MAG: hypothetical protein AMXMBFR61_04950 [Fimbriimonadales bacterium]